MKIGNSFVYWFNAIDPEASISIYLFLNKKDCLFTWGEGPRPFSGLTELVLKLININLK